MRMRQYCENAMAVATALQNSEHVESVKYPGLKSDEDYELAQKYLPTVSAV